MSSGDRESGILHIGIQRLLYRYPLLGGIVAAMNLKRTPDGTVAVGLGDGEFVLYYDPKFVSAIKLEELVGVLHHECRHLVYGHPLMTPEQYPDSEELTIAQELTVNENLPEPLPCDPILLKDYPELPPDEDTETRYGRLGGRKGRPENPGKAPGDDGEDDESVDSGSGADESQEEEDDDGECDSSCDACRGAKKNPAGDDSSDEAGGSEADADCGGGDADAGERARAGGGGGDDRADPGDDDGGAANGHGDAGDEDSETGVQTLDDHSRWHEVAADEPFARSLIESAMEEAAERRGEITKEDEVVLEAAAEGWGIDPGRIKSLVEPERSEAKVDWRRELRRYVGRELDRSPSYSRPPRRYPHLVGIVPGVVRRSARPRILAVVDTSGSISDQTLNEFAEELRHIARGREVFWADCDTEVRSVHKYDGPLKGVEGRGGTDFRPPFERKFLRKHKVDLVIFLTDGDGPAPEHKPHVPVVWLLTPGGEPPATWGRVVRMDG